MKRETVSELQQVVINLVEANKDKTEFMDILSTLWDVYHKPSTGEDVRYHNLGDEIEKHFVMNDDWAFSKLFVSILQYDQSDEKYYSFLEALFNMTENLSQDDVEQIKGALKDVGYYVTKSDKGVFSISTNPDAESANYQSPYPIVVCDAQSTKQWGVVQQTVQWPDRHNCLVLALNEGWNDYSSVTWYVLYYINDQGEHMRMGDVKIMHEDDIITPNKLPLEFDSLDAKFCSIGQSVSYYQQLRELFGPDAYKILFALRDSAISTITLRKFEKHSCFINSLIRTDDAERALRLGRFILQGRDLNNAFSYDFIFKKEFDGIGEVSAVIPFHFKYGCPSFKRAIALIGENGVGKTSLIKDMIDAILHQRHECFDNRLPVISQLMLVSYSPFDRYLVAPKSGLMGYQYRGLLSEKGNLLSPEDQAKILIADVCELLRRVGTSTGIGRWEKYMSPILGNEEFGLFVDDEENGGYKPDVDRFTTWYMHLSSGEALFANTVSALLAYIRHDSIVILDEPEQHLHPRAVSVLIRTILSIAEAYESYVVIATHSPMVIREMTSDNVLIMSRTGNNLSVAKICVESFGEDVSILTDVVFRDCQDIKQYENTIKKLIKQHGLNYDAVVHELENGHNKLGLNLRLMIRTMIDEEREKQQ